ncbi:DUF2490 domain-containing protein [Flavobacterium wongokense]|uniref:DUF2490 domain-containing protein n=1 Tax=Flavobacterium wongokense TaxID=2910674 RepID=UPI001F20956B|nr:DUF2490 domain-containing protein [Flavobacterium sp. WG47]MCF6130934.1 DUF2490 domain-containing protein [Flavobacterium sp. WG47]
MKRILFLLLLLVYGNCFAQKTVQDQRTWFAYIGQWKVSEKWGFHVEGQLRYENHFDQNLQNVFRIGGIYFIKPNEHVTVGYGLIHTYSASADEFFTENRLWEQYQINNKWSKNTMTHRLRLEQRWIEQLADNSTAYQNRFRYMNRNLFHIADLKSDKNQIYAVLQDEVFLTIGENKVNSKFMDQNRFLVGLGLNHNNKLRLELGYMNQYVTSSYGNDAMNHTVSVTLFHNLDLQKH